MTEDLVGKEKNKLKIIYVLELMKKTDEFHPMNSTKIIAELEKHGIAAERKAIGRDIQALNDAGYEIVRARNRNDGWYMISQDFEDHELKMLADAVASAKFLTVNDTRALLKKIKNLATKEGERIINAGLVIEDSMKMEDSGFAIKFDKVMRAIADHKKIRFQYADEESGRQQLKNNGMVYQVTPYYLGVWGDEYFIVANTDGYSNTSHYRVALMANLEVTDIAGTPMSEVDELKEIGKGRRTFGDYIKESVNLWSGQVRKVKISGINRVRREVVKKFGRDLMFKDAGDGRFSVSLCVAEGEGFYQWIASFGFNMKIEGPQEYVDGYRDFLKRTLEQYEE